MNFTKEQWELISHTCVGIDPGILDKFILNFGETFESITFNSRNNPFFLQVLKKIKLVQRELTLFTNRKKNKSQHIQSRQYFKIKEKLEKLEKLWTKYKISESLFCY